MTSAVEGLQAQWEIRATLRCSLSLLFLHFDNTEVSMCVCVCVCMHACSRVCVFPPPPLPRPLFARSDRCKIELTPITCLNIEKEKLKLGLATFKSVLWPRTYEGLALNSWTTVSALVLSYVPCCHSSVGLNIHL